MSESEISVFIPANLWAFISEIKNSCIVIRICLRKVNVCMHLKLNFLSERCINPVYISQYFFQLSRSQCVLSPLRHFPHPHPHPHPNTLRFIIVFCHFEQKNKNKKKKRQLNSDRAVIGPTLKRNVRYTILVVNIITY